MLARSSRAIGIAPLAALALILVACSSGPAGTAPPTINSTQAAPSLIPALVPTSSPAPSVAAAPTGKALIAEGTYLSAPMTAALVRARLDTDKTLTSAQKAEVIQQFMLGHQTQQTKLELTGGSFTESQAADGGAFGVGLRATYAFPGDGTLLIQETCCGTSVFDVVPTSTGFSLKIHERSAVNAGVDFWDGALLFEGTPFTPAP